MSAFKCCMQSLIIVSISYIYGLNLDESSNVLYVTLQNATFLERAEANLMKVNLNEAMPYRLSLVSTYYASEKRDIVMLKIGFNMFSVDKTVMFCQYFASDDSFQYARIDLRSGKFKHVALDLPLVVPPVYNRLTGCYFTGVEVSNSSYGVATFCLDNGAEKLNLKRLGTSTTSSITVVGGEPASTFAYDEAAQVLTFQVGSTNPYTGNWTLERFYLTNNTFASDSLHVANTSNGTTFANGAANLISICEANSK